MKYYDIGVNLFCSQFRDPEKVLREAAEAEVSCILTGSDMEENENIVSFLKDHDCYGTAGIHPHNADSAKVADFARIAQIVRENARIVAVGECGLDFDRMFSTKENQIHCLEEQIAIAEQLDVPMFLHERAAAEDFEAIFREHPEVCRRSVVHCFTEDRRQAEIWLSMGFYIGVTGWICDERRAEDLRHAVAAIPLDRILVETDAPYLIPRGIKGLGRVNVPQNIVHVVRALSEYMGVEEDVVTRAAYRNTENLFRLGTGDNVSGKM